MGSAEFCTFSLAEISSGLVSGFAANANEITAILPQYLP
jgi:hypothetical protein